MSERKLRNRKRRASKGRAIRVSTIVYAHLDKARRGRSWDAYLRKLFGLPDRAGNNQPLIEGCLEATTGIFVLRLAGATWPEVEETAWKIAHRAAMKQKSKRTQAPIRMRELA